MQVSLVRAKAWGEVPALPNTLRESKRTKQPSMRGMSDARGRRRMTWSRKDTAPCQPGRMMARISWHGPGRLRELRAGVATLTNAALEREGHAVAVSHESLKARGYDREAVTYSGAYRKEEVVQTLAARPALHRDYHPWENDLNRAAW